MRTCGRRPAAGNMGGPEAPRHPLAVFSGLISAHAGRRSGPASLAGQEMCWRQAGLPTGDSGAAGSLGGRSPGGRCSGFIPGKRHPSTPTPDGPILLPTGPCGCRQIPPALALESWYLHGGRGFSPPPSVLPATSKADLKTRHHHPL